MTKNTNSRKETTRLLEKYKKGYFRFTNKSSVINSHEIKRRYI